MGRLLAGTLKINLALFNYAMVETTTLNIKNLKNNR